MSAPEIFLTWVAARTSRIRIGHGVVCMPFNYNHPVRVAERAAMLDVLSGGRARPRRRPGRDAAGDVAVRRRPRATPITQVEEALRMISGACWTRRQFEWHGLLDIAPRRCCPARCRRRIRRCSWRARKQRHRASWPPTTASARWCWASPASTRSPRCATVYDEAIAERTGERFVSTVRQRPLRRAVPDDRPRRRASGAAGSAPAASGSSPSRSRTGTAAAPPRGRHRGRRQRGRARELGDGSCVAKLHEANIPVRPVHRHLQRRPRLRHRRRRPSTTSSSLATPAWTR